MTAVYDLTQHLPLDQQAQDLLFREARTANAFDGEPVSDEQVRAVYDLVARVSASTSTAAGRCPRNV